MKRLVCAASIVVVCLLSAAACQQAGPLSDQDKAAIQKAHDEFVRMMTADKADPAGLVKMYYADDARVLPPNMPAMEGQAAIGKGFAAMGQAKSFKMGPLAVTGQGGTAYVEATWEGAWAMPPSGEVVADKGKFIEVWQKQADGAWKATRDMWSSDAPPPGIVLMGGALKVGAPPELKQLDWFAGRWMWEAEAKTASPFGPAGKSSMAMDCRWFAGGGNLFCAVDGTTPAGAYHDLMIFTYDADAKAFKGYDADNMGMASPFALAFKKDTWTFDYDLKMAGKPAKLRLTLFDLAKDGCSFKQELATGGGALGMIAEGKAKRLQG